MRKSLSLNQVDLNLLNVFHLLMQERSVTRAAVRAGRTQSAVSHALRRLRGIFDDELFVKRGQVMEPTAQAHELSTVVSRALEDIQNAVDRHLRFNPQDSRRHFQVMVSDYTEALYMPTLIDELARQAPQCSLSAIPIRGNDINDLMRRPELDCAVLGNPDIGEGHLTSTVLARHRMVCAGWAGNRLLDELTLENYLALPHLQISATGSNRGVSDIALAELGLSRHVAATISHYIVAPRVLKGTNMITAFADGMLLLMDDSSQTKITTPPINLPDVQISLTHAPSKQADAGHIWLRSCIRNVVRLVEERRFEALKPLH